MASERTVGLDFVLGHCPGTERPAALEVGCVMDFHDAPVRWDTGAKLNGSWEGLVIVQNEATTEQRGRMDHPWARRNCLALVECRGSVSPHRPLENLNGQG